MRKKILIALDGSEGSMRAVEHVKDVTCGNRDLEITLFHVCFDPPSLLEHGGSEDPTRERQLDVQLHQKLERWIQLCRDWIEKDVFERAKAVLEGRGVGADVVTVLTKVSAEAQADVALSIIQEARKGDYDAVVLGRHGASAHRSFVFGSTSSKVIHNLVHCAVWVVS